MHSLSTTRTLTAMVAGALLLCGLAPTYGRAADDVPVGPPPIAITPSDGFNLVVKEQIDGHHVVVAVSPAVHNFFAGQFTSLPTDAPLTIGLNMNGIECIGNKAEVRKWVGLIPLMTYADPTKYESYECYERTEEGAWLCTDPLRPKDKRHAGMEETPEQTVIPQGLAKEFLSKDGKRWEPWREVDGAQAFPDTNVFRITHRFRAATATVAMRVPYTYTYQQQYLDRLAAAKLPGVTVVDRRVLTAAKRVCRIVRMAPIAAAPADRRGTTIVYAREHATEPDGSWVVAGMIERLLSDDPGDRAAREACTWLFIPILDIDGACSATMVAGEFFTSARRPVKREAYAYASYIVDEVDAGQCIDMVVNLHNVEAGEAPNLMCPFMNRGHVAEAEAANALVYERAGKDGYATSEPSHRPLAGYQHLRLAGWCSRHFSTVELAYEVNTRAPRSRLAMQPTRALAGSLLLGLAMVRRSDPLRAALQSVADRLPVRVRERDEWYQMVKRSKGSRNYADIFEMGY